MIAKRGDLCYGVTLTATFDILFVEVLQTDGGFFLERVCNKIHFNTTFEDGPRLDQSIRVTVSCFVGNAHLKEQFPGLEAMVVSKVHGLISKIPKPEVFSF